MAGDDDIKSALLLNAKTDCRTIRRWPVIIFVSLIVIAAFCIFVANDAGAANFFSSTSNDFGAVDDSKADTAFVVRA